MNYKYYKQLIDKYKAWGIARREFCVLWRELQKKEHKGHMNITNEFENEIEAINEGPCTHREVASVPYGAMTVHVCIACGREVFPENVGTTKRRRRHEE